MLMNRIETAVINSAARRGLQRFYEVPLLARLGDRVAGGRVLEVGCGSGEGTRLILDKFGAAHVDALDLDPAMVEKARRRLARCGSDRVRLPWAAPPTCARRWAHKTPATTRCSSSGSSITSRTGGAARPRTPRWWGAAGGSSSAGATPPRWPPPPPRRWFANPAAAGAPPRPV